LNALNQVSLPVNPPDSLEFELSFRSPCLPFEVLFDHSCYAGRPLRGFRCLNSYFPRPAFRRANELQTSLPAVSPFSFGNSSDSDAFLRLTFPLISPIRHPLSYFRCCEMSRSLLFRFFINFLHRHHLFRSLWEGEGGQFHIGSLPVPLVGLRCFSLFRHPCLRTFPKGRNGISIICDLFEKSTFGFVWSRPRRAKMATDVFSLILLLPERESPPHLFPPYFFFCRFSNSSPLKFQTTPPLHSKRSWLPLPPRWPPPLFIPPNFFL